MEKGAKLATNSSLVFAHASDTFEKRFIAYDDKHSNIINNKTDDDFLSCERIKDIIRILNTTIPLIWIVVGTITNGLSLMVFSRKQMRRNSTFFYLALMTLSDFIGKYHLIINKLASYLLIKVNDRLQDCYMNFLKIIHGFI